MAINPFQPFQPPSSGGGNSPSARRTSVDTKHRDYLHHLPDWNRVSDVLAGERQVRANARQYVPQTAEHVRFPDTYDAMVARTLFVNYTARCLDSLEGMIFRKDPSVDVPPQLLPRLENINNAGDHINTFAKKLVRNVLGYGRGVILVDSLPSEQQSFDRPLSKLPYLTLYNSFSVTNWRESPTNGQHIPDQVILQEPYDEREEFGSTQRMRYKVLSLDEQGEYQVQIFDQRTETGEYYESWRYKPTESTIYGPVYFKEIPIVFINPVDLSMDLHRSPILDLVNANLNLFYLQSEYTTALHHTASPTPIVTGWRDDLPGTLRFGGNNVAYLPEGATVQMLEFHGHALGSYENAIASTREYIAELGARLSENRATSPETAEAARIRQTAQTSVVSSIARTCSDGIEKALQYWCKWAKIDGKVSVELNQDYVDVQPNPQMSREIITMYREGLLTLEDVADWQARNELLPPGKSIQEHVASLRAALPLLLGQIDPAIRGTSRVTNGVNGAAAANGQQPGQQSRKDRRAADRAPAAE